MTIFFLLFLGKGGVGEYMMLLGIDWFVVEDSRRKAAINVLFLCEIVVERIKDQTLLRYS
jgi:hypothetical protein